MTIETKYNIGDKVWYAIGKQMFDGKILAIHILKNNIIMYIVRFSVTHCTFSEDDLFPTKEELLKSL